MLSVNVLIEIILPISVLECCDLNALEFVQGNLYSIVLKTLIDHI